MALPQPSWFCPNCAARQVVPRDHCARCNAVAFAAASRVPPRATVAGGSRGARRALLIGPMLLIALVAAGVFVTERQNRGTQYAAAESALAAGRYDEALAAFAAAGNYRDAPSRRLTLATARGPAEASRTQAERDLAHDRPAAAIAALLPVVRRFPADRAATLLLTEARTLRRDQLADQAATAETRRDWLGAERALAALGAEDPGDPAVAARLATLRREHAPLVVARDRALWLIDPSGAEDRLLTNAVPVARPVWSPDRTRIAFVAAVDEGGRAAAALQVIAADGTGLRQVSATAHPSALPSWSPNGEQIAYTSVADWDPQRGQGRLAVHVVALRTGQDRDVTAALGRTERDTGGDPGTMATARPAVRHAMSPWWAADGRLAVIGRGAGLDPSQPATGPGDLFVIDLATGRAENLTRGRVPDLIRAFWSPRGDRVLLSARTWHGESGLLDARVDLLALDPLTGDLTPLATAIDAAAAAWVPAWAPDGSQVAFLDGFSTIIFQGERGGERRVDIEGTLSGALTWAPGGEALLAVAADPSQPSLILDFTGTAGAAAADGDAAFRPVIRPLRIAYDADWRAGVPQWGPVLPAPSSSPAGLAGVGLNPEGIHPDQ